MRKVTVLAAAVASLVGLSFVLQAAEPASIKDVMNKAHRGKPALCAKCVQGKATADEKKTLLALYEDLAKAEPPKGDKESWKAKTDALIKAARGLVDGDKKAVAAYKKALDCKGCHSVHKG